ncbi:MAG TPA: hypothetical protein VLH84_06170 [Patescibacteria group bacterium]|nr:hypothetical protein [Patescibacteria group bacterium]
MAKTDYDSDLLPPDHKEDLKAAEQDAAQQHYNREFSQMTDPENYKESADHPLGERESSAADSESEGETEGKGNKGSTSSKSEAESSSSDAPSGGFVKKGGEGKGGAQGKKGDGFVNKYLKKRKVYLAASIITLLGGGIITLISSSPFEAIHIAQLLNQFHFSEGQNQSDDTMSKIARYINDRKPENTRMGILGNKFANKIEARFNVNGIATAYTPLFGFLDGYMIDPIKLADVSDTDLKSAARIEAYLKEQGIPFKTLDDAIIEYYKEVFHVNLQTHADNPHIPKGKLFAPAVSMTYSEKPLIKTMVREAGLKGITGALSARIMGKRAGVTWHPIKKLDAALFKTVDQKLSAWLKKRAANIQDGENIVVTAESETDPKDKAATANAADAQAATEAELQQLQQAGDGVKSGDPAPLDSFIKSTGFKITAGGVGLISIACLAQALAAQFDSIQEKAAILPQIRLAGEAESVGSEAENGGPDMDLEQLGFYTAMYHDDKTNTSWADARSIQAELHQPQNGPDIPDNARVSVEGNTVTKFLNSIPGLGTVCKAADSAVGQVISFGISFIGGPISAIATSAIGVAVQPLIPQLLGWLAGHPVPTVPHGADYGSFTNYGGFFAENDIEASTGGHVLTPQEVGQLQTVQAADDKAEFASHNIAYRLFNLYNPHTLASILYDKINPGIMYNISTLTSNLLSMLPHLASLFGSLLSARTSAIGPVDFNYGAPHIGVSLADLNNPLTKNPFKNADDVINKILPGPDGQALIDRAKACNGMNVGLDGTVTSTGEVPSAYDQAKPENHCAEDTTEWAQVSAYIRSTVAIESYACYAENDPQSCDDLGFPTGTLSDPRAGAAAFANPPSGYSSNTAAMAALGM